MSNWSVTLNGFATQAQAEAFAEWFFHQGEKDCVDWLFDNTDLSAVGASRGVTDAANHTVALAITPYVKDADDLAAVAEKEAADAAHYAEVDARLKAYAESLAPKKKKS